MRSLRGIQYAGRAQKFDERTRVLRFYVDELLGDTSVDRVILGRLSFEYRHEIIVIFPTSLRDPRCAESIESNDRQSSWERKSTYAVANQAIRDRIIR